MNGSVRNRGLTKKANDRGDNFCTKRFPLELPCCYGRSWQQVSSPAHKATRID